MTSVRVATMTCSDTRTESDDEGGELLRRLLESSGFGLGPHRIVREELPLVRAAVSELLMDERWDAIVITGGTGVGPRDRTIAAISPLLDRVVAGFGEAFRRLSWDQVGARSILSNALGGTARGKVVCALPGSPKAVRLGVEQLIAPMLAHMVDVARGRSGH